MKQIITKRYIDVEPLWRDIVKGVNKDNLEHFREDLNNMAKICDLVRQSQKDQKILVLYPNGRIVRTDKLNPKSSYYDRKMGRVMPCNIAFQGNKIYGDEEVI